MSISLYKLADAYMQAIRNSTDEETGEIVSFDAIDAIKDQYDQKAINCALHLKDLMAEAEAIKAEEKILKERRLVLEKNVESLKNFIMGCMKRIGEGSIADPRVKLNIRNNPPRVEVYNEALIPEKFFRVKTMREQNKSDIAKAIKLGVDIAGAKLVPTKSLQIK